MFFVHYGHLGPDSYNNDDGPRCDWATFDTEEEVLDFHKEFLQELDECCSHITFLVVEGKKREISEKTRVTEYVLD